MELSLELGLITEKSVSSIFSVHNFESHLYVMKRKKIIKSSSGNSKEESEGPTKLDRWQLMCSLTWSMILDPSLILFLNWKWKLYHVHVLIICSSTRKSQFCYMSKAPTRPNVKGIRLHNLSLKIKNKENLPSHWHYVFVITTFRVLKTSKSKT